jgi:hypothetical protein
MKTVLRVLISLPAVAVAIGAAGCSSSVTSPTSPSVASQGATTEGTVQAGATISGSELAVQLIGIIQSIKAPNLRLRDRTVVTNADTLIKRGPRTIALSEVWVGDKAMVEGTSRPDGSVLASRIRVRDFMNEDGDEGVIEFRGRIEAIRPPSLIVSGRRVVTRDRTQIFRAGKPVRLTDLRVGEDVTVRGSRQPDRSMLARELRVDDENDDDFDEDDEAGDS